MIFHRTPGFLRQLYPSLVWSMSSHEKSIYLTFDDGPIPGLTEFILDTLHSFQASATFFCVGHNLVKNREIAQRAIEEGHQLANHTYHHTNGWKLPTYNYLKNMELCENELKTLNQSKKLFRPPYGKMKRAQIKSIKQSHSIIMWDVLSGDYSKKIQPKQCLLNTIKSTKNGSIVLFHDNVKAQKNVEYALPRYIEHFRNKDFQFKLL